MEEIMEGTTFAFLSVTFIFKVLLGGLGIYALILLIKALKIYIKKNS